MKNRKGLFVLLVFYLFFATLSANKSVIIKINTGECLKCYAAQIYTNNLLKYTTVKLAFPENFLKWERYIKMQFPVNTKDYTIICCDSIYNKLPSNGPSQIYLFEGDELTYTCTMKEFASHFDEFLYKINGSLKANKSVPLPDSIYFDQVEIKAIDDKFALFNSSMQELVLYNGMKFFYLTPDKINIYQLFPFFDRNNELADLYRQNHDLLAAYGKANITISSVYLNQTHAMVLVQSPYIFHEESDRYGVKSKPFICKINLNNFDQHWFYLDDSNFPINWHPLYPLPIVDLSDDRLIISIRTFESDPEKDLQYLASLKFQDDTLIFNNFLDYQMPEFHIKYEVYHDQLYPTCKRGILYHQFASDIIDLSSGEAFTLPIENSKFEINMQSLSFEYDFIITDVVRNEQNFRMLYRAMDGTCHLGSFNKSDNDYTSVEIKGIDTRGISFVFPTFSEISWYDKNENSVLYKTID